MEFPDHFKRKILFNTRNIRHAGYTIKAALLENTKMLQLQMTLTEFSHLEAKTEKNDHFMCLCMTGYSEV